MPPQSESIRVECNFFYRLTSEPPAARATTRLVPTTRRHGPRAQAALHGVSVLRALRPVVPADDPLRLDLHGHAREAAVRGAVRGSVRATNRHASTPWCVLRLASTAGPRGARGAFAESTPVGGAGPWGAHATPSQVGLPRHAALRRGVAPDGRRHRGRQRAVPGPQPELLPRLHLGADLRGPGGGGHGVLHDPRGAAPVCVEITRCVRLSRTRERR